MHDANGNTLCTNQDELTFNDIKKEYITLLQNMVEEETCRKQLHHFHVKYYAKAMYWGRDYGIGKSTTL